MDDPQWRIPDRRAAYLTRAVAARAGLWGNHAYEAVYGSTFDDAEGKPLTGAHAYVLRFDSQPPVDAFWSVTMYALPDYYLVANPAGRYSIGDRTPDWSTARTARSPSTSSTPGPPTRTRRPTGCPRPRASSGQ